MTTDGQFTDPEEKENYERSMSRGSRKAEYEADMEAWKDEEGKEEPEPEADRDP